MPCKHAGRQDILPFSFLTALIIFFMVLNYQIKKILVVIIPVLFIYGCSVWGNFSTYFNLYYNTEHLFNDAEQLILEQRTDLFAVDQPPITSAANQKLQGVIEKCSNILQFHAETKYVDDALLMLGKSFYYQGNYLKSSREFKELLATQQESDLLLEANLWLGKCQMRLGDFTTGLQTLKNVKDQAVQQEENKILEAALIEEIKYKVSTKDYTGAIQSSSDFLKVSKDNSTSAKVAYELGKLYEMVNDEEGAAAAYSKVLDYSPSYQTGLDARIALGKALRSAGHNDQALTIFEGLSSEDKNKDSFDRINLEKGITLESLGKFDEAINTFVMVDTAYKGSQYSGAAKFELGKIYEEHFNNFDSASVYYLQASANVLPPEYLLLNTKKVEKFKKYNSLVDDLNFNKEELRYALNPEEFVKDSAAYYDSLKNIGENKTNSKEPVGNNPESRRTINLANIQTNQTRSAQTKISKPPVRPSVSADSLTNKIVYTEYELGNLFFTEFSKPDSAYYYYSDILNNYPDNSYRSKTLFVMGNYYLSKGDSVKADSLFNYIYNNYKNESIVNAAAGIINKPLIDLKYDPAKDIYSQAESELMKKNYYGSIQQLRDIYSKYPASATAPKALFAEGWIFENKLNKPDSAAVIYDSLRTKYPSTEYAARIISKLDFYHAEKKKINDALKDSLNNIQKGKNQTEGKDSLKTEANKIKENEQSINKGKGIPPGFRGEINDSLKEKMENKTKVDTLIRKERLLNVRDEILLRDSLLKKEETVPKDTAKKKIRE